MRRSLFILVAAVLSVYGCGGDSGTGPVIEEEEPLAADTIGTTGGTFDAGGFQLIVPPGAFASETPLTLYESSEEHGFGDGCISEFFRLDGLPESFAESLTVRLAYEGTAGDDVMVAMGEELMFYDDDYDSTEALGFDFFPATESSGYIEAVIPAGETTTYLSGGSSPSATPLRKSRFVATKGIDLELKSAHVRVAYPVSMIGEVREIVDYIEAAHDTIVSIGMGYDGKFWTWPIMVTIKDLRSGGTPILMPVRYHLSAKGGFKLDIHQPFISEANQGYLRYFLGNIMIFAAQRIPTVAEYYDLDHYPWNCAVAAWMQEFWPGPGSSGRPKNFAGNEMYAIAGLPVDIIDPKLAPGYGAGWSAVIKYLVDHEGRSLIGSVYRATQTTDEKPVPDLMERISDPAYSWWPQFVHKYVTGQIYNADTSVLLSKIGPDEKRTIKAVSDTAGLFFRSAYQLSAGMYRLYLDYAQIQEGAAFKFVVSASDVDPDWFTMLIYKVKDGVMEQIASGDTVTVGGLRDLTIGGYDLVLVDVFSYNDDPYTGTTLPTIKYRLIKAQTFTDCKIRVGYTGEWQVGDADPYWDYIAPGWYAEGTFSGNTFTGQIAQWYHGDQTTGSMTVTIDPETMSVTSFSANAVTVDAWGTSRWGVTGGGLPKTSYTPGSSLYCKVEGAGTCYYVSSIQWSYVPVSGDRWDIISYMCEATAGLELTFWDYSKAR